jgi:DNA-binding NtrC family response regulator
MRLRYHHPEPPDVPCGSGGGSPPPKGRLSLLVTSGGWRPDDFADQLPRLLGPLGIDCHRCRSGLEATEFLRRASVHIAIVDLSIPMEPNANRDEPAGPRVLQLLRRLDQPPPTVVVRPPQPSTRESARGLADALRDGAFAVIDGPVRLECMLETLRRVIRRHYRDHWPAA